MTTSEAVTTIIKIAAELARGANLPSMYREDYQQKTYSAARVAEMMVAPTQYHKDMAYTLRQCVNVLDTEIARVTLQSCLKT